MTREELKSRLLRPLKRELADGARDKVVAGGVEKLVENLGKPFPQVRELIRGYSALSAFERMKNLSSAIALLEDQPAEGEPPVQASKPSKPSERPPSLSTRQKNQEKALRKAPAGAPPDITLDSPVDSLALGVQARRKLAELGVRTVRDLLHYYPRRYEDRRALKSIHETANGEKATLVATVLSKNLVRTSRKQMQLVQVRMADSWGHKFAAIWFNQPWVLKQLAEGGTVIISGKVQRKGGVTTLHAEYFEDEGTDSLSTNRIVPVYPTKEGTGQAFLRRSAKKGLEAFRLIPDPLTRYLKQEALETLDTSLRQVHFPESAETLSRAVARLKFDEFLLLELKVMIQSGVSALRGRTFQVTKEMISRFKQSLPFTFTKAQDRVLAEVLTDMRSERQMARLVQGDVGSGKTAVAAAALFVASENNVQSALMAPTEILAKQHFENLSRYLFPLGVSVELLVGSMTGREKQAALDKIKGGEAHVVVGTHALIQEGVTFKDLGLAVIDEEHRFGVMQRRGLLGSRPDVLVMSATPIPRSLALTMYGDLETSQIDELPPGRTPIQTKILTQKTRRQAYAFAQQEIARGHQVFAVAPMIEEGESDATAELRAATKLANELRQLLPDVRIALLHGKMPSQEKDNVMERFRKGEFDLLVSTTVIEVGVDIPQATLMIIENAERFGLAQLHQLRGRVGRGGLESYCILVAGDASQKTLKRLKVIEESTDGFYIAEKDLELRGPGELRGTRQSGFPELILGDLAKDTEIIERSRALAKSILEADPHLDDPEHLLLKRELQARAEAIGFREVI